MNSRAKTKVAVLVSTLLGVAGCLREDTDAPVGERDAESPDTSTARDASPDDGDASVDGDGPPAEDVDLLDRRGMDLEPPGDSVEQDVQARDVDRSDVDRRDIADGSDLDVGETIPPTTTMCATPKRSGDACTMGGDACLQPSIFGCSWFGMPLCCYEQCVCTSSPGVWECYQPICESQDSSGGCEGGTMAGSLEGGLLIDTGEWVQSLHVEGSYLYWLSLEGRISRMPIAGGAVEPLLVPGASSPLAGIALDDTSIYGLDQGKVFSIPLAGGTRRELATSTNNPTKILSGRGTGEIYIGEQQSISAVPKMGGPPRPLLRTSADAWPVLDLQIGSDLFFSILQGHPFRDAGERWTTQAIERVSVTGGAEVGVAWMLRRSGRGAAADSDLYLSRRNGRDSDQLIRIPSTGGPPTVLYTTGAPKSVHWIGLDASYVYFSMVEYACKHSLMRIPKGGGDAELLVLGMTMVDEPAVVVDAGKLFWATGQGRTTIRMLNL